MHRFIAAERANHAVAMLYRVLGVSRAGFYAAEGRSPSQRALADRRILAAVREIHSSSRETYGAPSVHAMLARRGVRVGRKRVGRLMRSAGLTGLVKRRRGKTTVRVPGVATRPDLVRREWSPAQPNRLWVADITYCRSWEGWLYLAAVLDCHSREVVAGRFAPASRRSSSPRRSRWRSPAAGAPRSASSTAPIAARMRFSCFGGSCREAGIDLSMTEGGSPLDNAVVKSFFATLERELVDRYSWPTRNDLRVAIFEWIEVFYNRQRLHTTLGNYAPEEFETLSLDQLKEAA